MGLEFFLGQVSSTTALKTGSKTNAVSETEKK